MTSPVQPDQLRISIEMGEQYQPSDRLSAALDELAAALAETESEVAGFALTDPKVTQVKMAGGGIGDFRAFAFDSHTATGWKVEEGEKISPFK